MLGLGDIVMPGLLLCFVMRYDAYKKAQVFSEFFFFGPLKIQTKSGLNILNPDTFKYRDDNFI